MRSHWHRWVILGLGLVVVGGCGRPEGEPRLFVEPYLQRPGRDTMTIVWWTLESAPESFVEYGVAEPATRAAATNEYDESLEAWRHEVVLEGLEEETLYHYRAVSDGVESARYTLETEPRRFGSVHFSFLGDGRTDDEIVIGRHRQLVEMAMSSDVVFELGDAVYDGSNESWLRYLRRIVTASDPERPGATTGSQVPCHVAIGNHEIAYVAPEEEDQGDAAAYRRPFESVERYQALFTNPPNGATDPRWEERYYTLRYGPVTFVVLDANNTSADELDNHDLLEDGTTPDWEPGSEQHRWMLRELERAQAESAFTFVLFHPSPYSSGVHGTPLPEQDAQRGYELRALDPIFRAHGVDAVITSHDHLAERSLTGPPGFEAELDSGDPANLNYWVLGDSGQESRPAADGWESWMSIAGDGRPPYHRRWFYSWPGQNFSSMLRAHLRYDDDEGVWRANLFVVRTDGRTFDELTLKRADPLGDPEGVEER